MIIKDEVIYKVPTESKIAKEALSIALDDSQWMPYHSFMAKQVSKEIAQKDEFLKWLSSRYSFNTGVLKYDPFTMYDWHKDKRRGVCINMLLSFDGSSMCLFSTNDQQTVRPVLEVQYTPNEYYVFNTQQMHTAFNFQKPRYLFTVEFDLDKDNLTYNELVNEIKENWI